MVELLNRLTRTGRRSCATFSRIGEFRLLLHAAADWLLDTLWGGLSLAGVALKLVNCQMRLQMDASGHAAIL